MPLALACVLLCSKVHERAHARVAELLAAAQTACPGFAQRCGARAVVAAELWLVLRVDISLMRPATDFCAEMIAQLCVPALICSRAQRARV